MCNNIYFLEIMIFANFLSYVILWAFPCIFLWLILIKWVSGISIVWKLDYVGLLLVIILFFWSLYLLYLNHFIKINKSKNILYISNILWTSSYWISKVNVVRVPFNKKLIYIFDCDWTKKYLIDLTTNPSLSLQSFKNWEWIDFYWGYETHSNLWKAIAYIREYNS